MACGYDELIDDIKTCGDARAVKGLEPVIYITPRHRFNTEIVGNTTFNGNFDPLIFDGFVKVSGVKDVFNTGHEGKPSQFSETGYVHSLTIVLNTRSSEIDLMDDIVALVERKGDKTRPLEVYGAKHGLWRMSDTAKANDNNALRTIEFASQEGMEEDFSCIIVDEESYIFDSLRCKFVDGVYLDNGESIEIGTPAMRLDVLISETYVPLNGLPYINTFPSGEIAISVPPKESENTTVISGGRSKRGITTNITGSLDLQLSTPSLLAPVVGAINVVSTTIKSISAKKAIEVFVDDCTALTYIRCQSATDISCTNCALTPDTIAVMLKDALKTGSIDGNFNVSGGTNSPFYAWSVEAQDDADTLQASGWTVTYNS